MDMYGQNTMENTHETVEAWLEPHTPCGQEGRTLAIFRVAFWNIHRTMAAEIYPLQLTRFSHCHQQLPPDLAEKISRNGR